MLTDLGDDLGLRYADDLPRRPRPVDDFIDPDLRRHAVTWDDLEIPEDLRTLAQAVWDDLLVLQAGHGADADASADLDVQSERYQELFRTAADISHDALETERRRLRELTEKPRRRDPQARPRGRRPAGEAGRGDRAHRRGGAPGR